MTTQLDLYSAPDPERTAELKRTGILEESDLITAGFLATAPGGHPPRNSGLPRLEHPEETESWVDARVEEGSEFIKVVVESTDMPTLRTAAPRAGGNIPVTAAVAHPSIIDVRGRVSTDEQALDGAIREEQDYLDGLYARVEQLRAEVEADLAAAPAGHGGSAQDLLDRDARMAALATRRADLERAENGLYFGRLDRADGERIHIGRMGLRDEELSPLLVDWRAPAAASFYTATVGSGSDVRRRRHIRTGRRRVTGVNDELLDLEQAGPDDGAEGHQADAFVGEAALMESLTAHRTGRMGDIVATLQGEQDRIIRSGAEGILVVQGGPGTGKTAVALHRAALLLYTYPRIAESGVLVVGPNATFLSYIEAVLPSLGETQAVLTTPDTLLPGVTPTRAEDAAVAALKGHPAMADVIAAAVADRQAPARDTDLTFDGDTFQLAASVIAAARSHATRGGHDFNSAGRAFREELWSHVTDLVVAHGEQLLTDVEEGFEAELRRVDASLSKGTDQLPGQVDAAGTEVTGTVAAHERDRVRAELEADADVAAVIDGLWPALTPEGFREDLLGDRDRLVSALAAIDTDQTLGESGPIELLHRSAGGGWSLADIALLDEAAELLGTDDTDNPSAAVAARERDLAYARRVLASTGTRGVSAEAMADRFAERDTRVLAERAAADRTWAYGHAVVDEAQELSPMQWRMLLRRVPSGSLTIVGDVHQTSSADGTTSWDTLTAAHPRRRWQVVELTVNYRTPQEVVDAALPVLRALDPTAPQPVSARSGASSPWRLQVDEDLIGGTAQLAAQEHAALAGGHLAVIAPPELLTDLASAVADLVPGTSAGEGLDLDSSCVVITPTQAKGLEFDGVLVADVGGILAAPRGLSDLYVAMTRTTSGLGLLHVGDAPEVIAQVPIRSLG
ncbi:PhoH family protein [Ornithinimicrobium faecis]|uniref:PhoH family protein n=1 Tax=Ornithinimicrobium faecis TaxID=2934158 RepID=A0ABY4YQA0_9MICO|nr:PhoH family protein [Ornithinimicrobium sp. HY1793]USQ78956.1 PhoH family protein [Ornithinimicrobium sp. HY1793]